jgi:hypothetical protein
VKNHHVPEFYFEPWLEPETFPQLKPRHLIQYGWLRGKLMTRRKTPGQICYRTDAFTFTDPFDLEGPHAVEHWITRYADTPAAPLIQRLLRDGLEGLEANSRAVLATFFMSLQVRMPRNVDFLERDVPGELTRFLEREESEFQSRLREKGISIDEETLLQAVQSRVRGYVKNAPKVMITELISDGRYAKRLLAMDWWTKDFSSTSLGAVPTTDSPMIMHGTDFNAPETYFLIPLSPEVVLYITPPETHDELMFSGLGILGQQTFKAILSRAKKFAYGTPDCNRNLIERYLPKQES